MTTNGGGFGETLIIIATNVFITANGVLTSIFTLASAFAMQAPKFICLQDGPLLPRSQPKEVMETRVVFRLANPLFDDSLIQ